MTEQKRISYNQSNCLFPGKEPVNIGLMLYPDFDSLDVLGPNQVFYFLGALGVKVMLIGADKSQPVTSLEGVPVLPQEDYESCPDLDMIFVPGGYGNGYFDLLCNDQDPFYDFVRAKAAKAKLVTCVCTGAHLMARAGLLKNKQVTTHWAYKEALALFPDVTVVEDYPRYVVDGFHVTGGGISSGIDEALMIAAWLKGDVAAEQVQLSMQYNPNPPFKGGDPATSPQSIVDTSGSWAAGAYVKTLVEDILAGKPCPERGEVKIKSKYL